MKHRLLILGAVAVLLAGCTSPDLGPSINANAEGVDSKSQRPTQATWIRRGAAELGEDGKPRSTPESHALNIAGPASNIVEIGEDGISQAGSGPAGQAIRLRQDDGTTIDAFSQTNLRATKREVIAKDGSRTVEVTFDSDSAKATHADGERLAKAIPIYQSLDEGQKTVIRDAIRRDRDIWKQAFDTAIPGLFDVVSKIVGV